MDSSVWVISYLIQLSLGAYAAFGLPMRGQLPPKYERARKAAIVFAFLPCLFFSVLAQVIYIGMYLAKSKTMEAQVRKAERAMGGGSTTSTGNPFGGATQPPRPPQANPFGSSGAGEPPAKRDDNPFQDDDNTGGAPTSNPFA